MKLFIETKPFKMDAPKLLLLEMMEFYGMKEILGPASNNKLIQIIRKYVSSADDDSTTSWCSILLDHVAKENGIERSDSPAAVSWKKVGQSIDIDDVKLGDIMVFYRSTESNWQGHVGVFISHSEKDGYVWLLGGNQSNQVNIQHQSLTKLRKDGIRRLNYTDKEMEDYIT